MPDPSVKPVLALHNVSVLWGAMRNPCLGQMSELDPAGMTSKAAIMSLCPGLAGPARGCCGHAWGSGAAVALPHTVALICHQMPAQVIPAALHSGDLLTRLGLPWKFLLL